jgi:hypothetical protein
MRRHARSTAFAALVAGLWLVGPALHAGAGVGDLGPLDPTTSTLVAATRGSPYQATPTDPPPTTTTPPTLPPTTPPTLPPTTPPTTLPGIQPPPNSGSGRRVIYSRSAMRVWIVDATNSVVRTYRVSGRYGIPYNGTYAVYSRSAFTCHLGNSHVCMRWMVRFAHGPTGDNIGFHEIPRDNGVPMQSDSQLGQALSSGCVRQSTADAQYMWLFGGIGTRVVVIS